MAFYRRITRARTLRSFKELDTDDEGLKKSISRFAKSPREAKYYENFQIHEDYCSERGRNINEKSVISLYEVDQSDSESMLSLDDEKYHSKSERSRSRNVEKKRYRKRYSKLSLDAFGGIRSDFESDFSYSDPLKENCRHMGREEEEKSSSHSRRSRLYSTTSEKIKQSSYTGRSEKDISEENSSSHSRRSRLYSRSSEKSKLSSYTDRSDNDRSMKRCYKRGSEQYKGNECHRE